MILDCKKAENCFKDSQTYEYRIPITGEAFINLLDESWSTRCNYKLRRPVFLSEKNELHIKGILASNVIRVSFPDNNLDENKEKFEKWLVTKLENI